MSEIKGQLLGIVLVLTLFGIVSGVLIAAFTSMSQSVGDKVNEMASSIDNADYNTSSKPMLHY